MSEHMPQHEDPLNLRTLPTLAPGRDGWPAIAAALTADRRQRRLRRVALVGLPVTAGLALALGLGLQQWATEPLPAPEVHEVAAADAAAGVTGAATPELEPLIALSQRMESRLRLLRQAAGALPADRVVHQVELEDLVIQIDEALSGNPEDLGLWRQRVGLLMDLETLYSSSLRREYHQMASL